MVDAGWVALGVGAGAWLGVLGTLAVQRWRAVQAPVIYTTNAVLGSPGDTLQLFENGTLVSTRRWAGGQLPTQVPRFHGKQPAGRYLYQRTDDRARVHVYELTHG